MSNFHSSVNYRLFLDCPQPKVHKTVVEEDESEDQLEGAPLGYTKDGNGNG